jgi:hypothetical protein
MICSRFRPYSSAVMTPVARSVSSSCRRCAVEGGAGAVPRLQHFPGDEVVALLVVFEGVNAVARHRKHETRRQAGGLHLLRPVPAGAGLIQ